MAETTTLNLRTKILTGSERELSLKSNNSSSRDRRVTITNLGFVAADKSNNSSGRDRRVTITILGFVAAHKSNDSSGRDRRVTHLHSRVCCCQQVQQLF